MTLRRISNAALGALLTLALHVGSANAQESARKSYPVVSRETYNRVLDILFPRDDPDPSQTVFALVLRFKPSFSPESQIVIKKDVNKVEKVEVVVYTSLDGDIYQRLNEALERGGKEDAAKMAKSIRVKRRTVSIHYTLVKQWHKNFLDSISGSLKVFEQKLDKYDEAGTVSFALDGTTYDLWYEQGVHKMAFSLYDFEGDTPGDDGEFRLVQWMNAVRREVEALSNGRRGEPDGKREASRRPPAYSARHPARRRTKARAAHKRKVRETETAARSEFR